MLVKQTMMQRWEEQQISVNGVSLHVVQAGPVEGPLVILLHGFPEYWYSWQRYIQPLAEAGYRVWVPDQRGYNLSSKPQKKSAYTLDTLAQDITGLMDIAGRDRARVIGHDWGGTVTWWLAMQAPERIERAVIINSVHPLVWMQSLQRSPAQFFRGWYLRFFQLPRLPEAVLRRKKLDCARLLADGKQPQRRVHCRRFSHVPCSLEPAWSHHGDVELVSSHPEPKAPGR